MDTFLVFFFIFTVTFCYSLFITQIVYKWKKQCCVERIAIKLGENHKKFIFLSTLVNIDELGGLEWKKIFAQVQDFPEVDWKCSLQ